MENNHSTVFIVDDDPAVRKGLEMLMHSTCRKAKSFACGEDFLKFYTPDMPGCLIADVRMPGISGLELQKVLKAQLFDIPMIFISGHGEISMAVATIQEGACDFLEKPLAEQHLLDSVQKALLRDKESRQEKQQLHQIRGMMKLLSAREKQILDGIMEGKPNKAIARALDISPKTIEFHRARIMDKMQADSIVELTRKVIKVQSSSYSTPA